MIVLAWNIMNTVTTRPMSAALLKIIGGLYLVHLMRSLYPILYLVCEYIMITWKLVSLTQIS